MELNKRRAVLLLVLQHMYGRTITIMLVMVCYYLTVVRPRLLRKRKRGRSYSLVARVPKQIDALNRMTLDDDTTCINKIRMNREAFKRLCFLLENVGGLTASRHVSLPEKVASFLSVLAHHTKNRSVQFDFLRSGQTISKNFHQVLKAVLKLHPILLVRPKAVEATCDDYTWKPFVGCLGALDGTYIPVEVKRKDQPRYRNRKGNIAVNVLAVCDPNMMFVYVLTGWEGSVADGRMLREAINKPNGFKIPQGNYYLVDCGYANAPGSLAPYRGVRYHLKEWEIGCLAPQNVVEYFNMKHSKARNVIERTFGLLKKRWACLRSPMFFSVETQNEIILACALIHNFIRMTHVKDPGEDLPDVELDSNNAEYIEDVIATTGWTNWRDELANSMYNEYRSTRRRRGQ